MQIALLFCAAILVMKESEQAHIPHALKLLDKEFYNEWQFEALVTGKSDRKPVSSKLHKIILAKVQKVYKLLLTKIISAFPVKMHIFTLCLSQNSVERFPRSWADDLF